MGMGSVDTSACSTMVWVGREGMTSQMVVLASLLLREKRVVGSTYYNRARAT